MKAVSHWWHQRLSALVLLILFPWFAINIMNTTPEYWMRYFSKPLPVMGLLMMYLSGLYHMFLGLTVVLEDYIANLKVRTPLIQLMKIKIFALLVFGFVCFIRLIVIGMHV
jgi:succinate dehydrogenase / fumarate reductase membrane anchor subunit